MEQIILTKDQAKTFLLLKHGLIGDYKFKGKEGVLAFISQAGCIQFDPIDICGRNAELVLQSRVAGFTKEMLSELLYHDRKLVDYFDKNLAILPTSDWIYFSRMRAMHHANGRGQEQINPIIKEIKDIIRQKGPISAKDTDFSDKVNWYWSATTLSRAALETMYFRGDLIIHHKKGNIKFYALSEDYLPKEMLEAKDPNATDFEYMKWRIRRRISGVGLLWNKPSDAFLYVNGLNASIRKDIFNDLFSEGKIIWIKVEGIKEPLYCLSEDRALIETVKNSGNIQGRTEFLAPLDNMLWDRSLVAELFDFEYRWEIYNPPAKRKYGYYVLPILSGRDLIGRIEMVNDKKNQVLGVKNIWYEKNTELDGQLLKSIEETISRFARFNGCREIKNESKL
jgi:uncharacterized protein YcaQ